MTPRKDRGRGGDTPRPAAPASPEAAGPPVLTPVTTAMNTVGALLVLGMVVIVNIDVFGRWLANAPLAGTLELTEMGVVAVVYLTIGHAVAGRRLTRSDAALGLLHRRGHRRTELALRTVFNAAGATVFTIIAWGQLPRLADAWNYNYFKGNVGIFTAPTWPLEAIMLTGAIAAALHFAALTVRRARALTGGSDDRT
ncbi:TRAP transporter small permease subunit [Meridianimarinicoccus roseus]|uniref:TRAP transporter small permease subunit n=1 Tax=Meridianimarinicoccus roseus TaxID=2072018 RepID=UPI001EE64D32|nr:TRAP transporter small permease [Meridianimarinicoccus roseus]